MKKLFILSLLIFNSTYSFAFNGIFSSWKNKTVQETVTIQPLFKIVELVGEFNFLEKSREIFDATKNNDIHGILLIVDSGGGASHQFGMLFDIIKKAAEYKPVVAFVSGAALSGGYLALLGADYVVAGSCALIGSIGVMMVLERYQDGTAKMKGNIEADLDIQIFTAGQFKAIGDRCSLPLSDNQKEYIKEEMRKAYQFFLQTVAQQRNLDLDQKDIWAEGKIFSGLEAFELGLIDQVGTWFEAEQKLLELVQNRSDDVTFDSHVLYIK